LLVLALLLGSVLAAGCGGPGQDLPPEWRGHDLRQPGWQNGTLAAGWTMGLEYVWSSGQRVSWDWFTGDRAILYFQVVHMQNGQPQPMVGQHRDNSTGSITVPQGGAYQVIFRNEGSANAALWFKVPEGYSQRLYPPGAGPSCFFLAGRATAAAASC
jgi:hypothetical protein